MPKRMEVISFSEAGVTPNFHVAYVKEGNSDFCILCSIHDGLLQILVSHLKSGTFAKKGGSSHLLYFYRDLYEN
jgi:ribosomal protein S26